MIPVPFEPGNIRNGDAILATHEHVDHVHGPSQALILENTGTTFYGPDDTVAIARDEERWRQEYAVTDDQLLEVAEGETFASASSSSTWNQRMILMRVIQSRTLSNTRFFHGGDSKPADAFRDMGERFDIDLGVLAFGTVGMIPDHETGTPGVTKWFELPTASAVGFSMDSRSGH